ncbi:MAG TPA: L,D-transpeptidase family protein [Chitinophagaceae bacterium]|nr:L,D-transpeptidase family protein [Chitinophagaceae bacterium]
MKKIFLFIVALFISSLSFAQHHRRLGYFETYLEVNEPIDSIVVFKAKREMYTYHLGKKVKKYMISLGMEPEGKKQFEGDLRTPEGLYYIDKRDTISSYHTNLNISYPNFQDSTYAAMQGRKAGGDIKIHGFPNNHTKIQEKEFLNTDWTIGCIAISDFEVDELYKWVIEYCPILIFP